MGLKASVYDSNGNFVRTYDIFNGENVVDAEIGGKIKLDITVRNDGNDGLNSVEATVFEGASQILRIFSNVSLSVGQSTTRSNSFFTTNMSVGVHQIRVTASGFGIASGQLVADDIFFTLNLQEQKIPSIAIDDPPSVKEPLLVI